MTGPEPREPDTEGHNCWANAELTWPGDAVGTNPQATFECQECGVYIYAVYRFDHFKAETGERVSPPSEADDPRFRREDDD